MNKPKPKNKSIKNKKEEDNHHYSHHLEAQNNQCLKEKEK